MDSSVSPKDEICFLRVCHHISNAVNYKVERGWISAGQRLEGSEKEVTVERCAQDMSSWIHTAGEACSFVPPKAIQKKPPTSVLCCWVAVQTGRPSYSVGCICDIYLVSQHTPAAVGMTVKLLLAAVCW
jgi:hypothetical protein